MISLKYSALLVLVFSSVTLVTAVSLASVGTVTKPNPNFKMRQNIKSSALNEANLIEELTGKKPVTELTATALKKAPLPVQHYYAGQKAATQKNYILAIKHFNTVIQKYPLSNQVTRAHLAKAQIYQEMGLQPQAERNRALASFKKKATGVAIHQDIKKTTK